MNNRKVPAFFIAAFSAIVFFILKLNIKKDLLSADKAEEIVSDSDKEPTKL